MSCRRRPNFSFIAASDRYVMWPIMRATAEPFRRWGGAVVVAVVPVGVGHDRLTADLVEGDGLRGLPRRAGEDDRGVDALRVGDGPLEHLHAAHAAADGGQQPLDAEMIEQQAPGR